MRCTILLTAAYIEKLFEDGGRELPVGEGAVLTPLALDRAKELGILLIYRQQNGGSAKNAGTGFRPLERDPGGTEKIRRVVRGVIISMEPGLLSPQLVNRITEKVKQQLGLL